MTKMPIGPPVDAASARRPGRVVLAYYSRLDSEWPARKAAFDAQSHQNVSLNALNGGCAR